MRTWCSLLVVLILARGGAVFAQLLEPDMISWGRTIPFRGWVTLILWSDGRSEIDLIYPPPLDKESIKLKSGWAFEAPSTLRKANPFSVADARKKFAAAVAAGITELKPFTPKTGSPDATPTVIEIRVRGRLTRITVPAFTDEGTDGEGKGSINHRRFLEIQSILGPIDMEAVELPK
jgi:hypothetical protein